MTKPPVRARQQPDLSPGDVISLIDLVQDQLALIRRWAGRLAETPPEEQEVSGHDDR